jgi:hypothetical protein
MTPSEKLVELLPCRECGAPCRPEQFPDYCGEIDFKTTVWLCSKHKMFGGDCPSDTAYLTADAWNTRASIPTPEASEQPCATCGATDPKENEYCSDGFHAPGKTYWPNPSSSEQDALREAMLDRMVEAWPDADAHHAIRDTCRELLDAALTASPKGQDHE